MGRLQSYGKKFPLMKKTLILRCYTYIFLKNILTGWRSLTLRTSTIKFILSLSNIVMMEFVYGKNILFIRTILMRELSRNNQ